MSSIIGSNSLIQFGGEINSQINNIQGEDIVLTKEVLNKTYPMTLSIKVKELGDAEDKYQNLSLPIRYHFCQNFHTEMSQEEYNNFIQKENYQLDERIFFINNQEEEG